MAAIVSKLSHVDSPAGARKSRVARVAAKRPKRGLHLAIYGLKGTWASAIRS